MCGILTQGDALGYRMSPRWGWRFGSSCSFVVGVSLASTVTDRRYKRFFVIRHSTFGFRHSSHHLLNIFTKLC
jgi:hypothetical protein